MKRQFYLNSTITVFLLVSVVSSKPYRGGELRTIDTYRYGRYEVSMRSASGSGIVSSFFTYRDYWTEGLSGSQHWNEIDWEILGQHEDEASTNLIIQNQWDYVQELDLDFNPHEDLHTYAIEWTPDNVLFFIDDDLVRTVDNFYADSMYHYQKIMMNLWQPTASSWVGTFDSDILPVYAFYDWVKYYAYVPGSGNTGTNNDFILLWTDDFDYMDPNRWQRATHTFDGNNVDFIEENVVFQYGHMILCLTTPGDTGYNGDPLKTTSTTELPYSISMGRAYPNPFNHDITFPVTLNGEGSIEYAIYDINGRIVTLGQNRFGSSRDRSIHWNGMRQDGTPVSSGTYFFKLINDDIAITQKILYLK